MNGCVAPKLRTDYSYIFINTTIVLFVSVFKQDLSKTEKPNCKNQKIKPKKINLFKFNKN